jgi:hypothetical protein
MVDSIGQKLEGDKMDQSAVNMSFGWPVSEIRRKSVVEEYKPDELEQLKN